MFYKNTFISILRERKQGVGHGRIPQPHPLSIGSGEDLELRRIALVALGFQLVQHEPFTSTDDAIKRGTDIRSTTQIIEMNYRSLRVADTDKGKELRQQVAELKKLLYAYRHGFIKESEKKHH